MGDARDVHERREREAGRANALRTITDALPSAAPDTAETRLRRTLGCLVAAARSWRRYLDEGGPDGPSATLARTQLARVAARITALAPAPQRRVASTARARRTRPDR